MDAVLVGGNPGYDVYIRLKQKLKQHYGINVRWHWTKRFGKASSNVDVVLVSADMCSHRLSILASALAKEIAVPIISIDRSWTRTVDALDSRGIVRVDTAPVEVVEPVESDVPHGAAEPTKNETSEAQSIAREEDGVKLQSQPASTNTGHANPADPIEMSPPSADTIGPIRDVIDLMMDAMVDNDLEWVRLDRGAGTVEIGRRVVVVEKLKIG